MLGGEFRSRLDLFLEDQHKLPSFGANVDGEVKKYIFGLTQWVIGNLIWSFETPRYFGVERDRVKETLLVYVKGRGEEGDTVILN